MGGGGVGGKLTCSLEKSGESSSRASAMAMGAQACMRSAAWRASCASPQSTHFRNLVSARASLIRLYRKRHSSARSSTFRGLLSPHSSQHRLSRTDSDEKGGQQSMTVRETQQKHNTVLGTRHLRFYGDTRQPLLCVTPRMQPLFWNSTTVSVSCLHYFDIRHSNRGSEQHTSYSLPAVFGTSDAGDC